MAEVTKVGVPTICTPVPPTNAKISELFAGEDLGSGEPCYIKAADNRVYKATGAAATEAAVVAGWTTRATKSGQPVTLHFGVMFGYVSGQAAGIPLYLSGTVAGGLATAASVGGLKPIARVIDANRIFALQLN